MCDARFAQKNHLNRYIATIHELKNKKHSNVTSNDMANYFKKEI